MKLIGILLVNILALFVVDYIVPGFMIADFQSLLVTAVVMGVVNTFLKPVVQIIAIPISILTLGIAAFLINVALLWGVAYVVPGFEIDTFLTAIISSILLSLVSAFLNKLTK